MLNRRKIPFLLLFLAPPIWMAYFVYRFGITVPFWDAWELVPLLEKMHSGNLLFSDLWAQHNEHRIFFPKLIMLGLAWFTGWKIAFELLTNFLLAALTLFFLCSLLRQTVGQSQSLSVAWLSIAFSWLLFSPAQWQNFSWGWQIQIFLSLLATVFAVWSISRWPEKLKGLFLAIGASLIASYSFISGLLTWIVIPVILVYRRRNWEFFILYSAAGAATMILYFSGYQKISAHPNLLFFLDHPFDFAQYVFAYLGSLLFSEEKIPAILIGLFLGVLTFIGFCRIKRLNPRKLPVLVPWCSLSLYALLSAIATAVGRSGFGVDQALSSRYTTFSALFIISALVTLVFWVKSHVDLKGPLSEKWRVPLSLISGLLILPFILSFASGEKAFISQKNYIERGLIYLENADMAPEEYLKIFYPNPVILRERTKRLVQMGLLKGVQWKAMYRARGG